MSDVPLTTALQQDPTAEPVSMRNLRRELFIIYAGETDTLH